MLQKCWDFFQFRRYWQILGEHDVICFRSEAGLVGSCPPLVYITLPPHWFLWSNKVSSSLSPGPVLCIPDIKSGRGRCWSSEGQDLIQPELDKVNKMFYEISGNIDILWLDNQITPQIVIFNTTTSMVITINNDCFYNDIIKRHRGIYVILKMKSK